MKFYVMSLFPKLVTGALDDSIIGRALSKKIISIETFNIRDYTVDKHRRTDDYPYGGGLGMIMQAQPVFDCYTEVCRRAGKRPKLIYMSPHGKPFTQKKAHELSKGGDIAILCGHYEGVDRRIIDTIVDEEISVGDYILSGGELPAAVLIDAVSRLLDGTLKTSESYMEESFEHGLLEYPQYTRPEEYEGMRVPEVLLSGNQG
ncbi:MAG: tRNA (guanosine(37)-N1)-methyltransferase TrmD, partial [Clostridia bacterium]|nr:tRNA (guanosine(37)-N1)-methyltransferase TrmD [Clostridia bacterium]